MVKNIVFDVGDVILVVENLKSIRPFFENEEDAKLVEKETFLSKEWKLLDKGLIELDEAMETWKKKIPEHLHQNMIKAIIDHGIYLKDNLEVLKIIDELKENGYKLYLLTNLNIPDYNNIIIKRKWYKKFDGEIVSGYVKTVKPEKEIYQKLFEKYNLIPEECFFIDDKKENTETGKMLGMKVNIFSDVEKLKKDLEKEGIKI